MVSRLLRSSTAFANRTRKGDEPRLGEEAVTASHRFLFQGGFPTQSRVAAALVRPNRTPRRSYSRRLLAAGLGHDRAAEQLPGGGTGGIQAPSKPSRPLRWSRPTQSRSSSALSVRPADSVMPRLPPITREAREGREGRTRPWSPTSHRTVSSWPIGPQFDVDRVERFMRTMRVRGN